MLGAVPIIAAVALLALFGAVTAQTSSEISVRPVPAVLSLAQGEIVTVTFMIENAQGLYGADVRAAFDPAVLEAVDGDPGQPGVQITGGQFLKPDFVVRSIADNDVGTVWYAATQVSPTLPVDGSGVLFSAVLRAKAPVKDAPLRITYAKLVDRNGRALAAQVAGQAPAESAQGAATPVATALPEPTAAVPTAAAEASPTQPAPPEPTPAVAPAPTPPAAPVPGLPPLCASPAVVLLPVAAVAAGALAWFTNRRQSGRN